MKQFKIFLFFLISASPLFFWPVIREYSFFQKGLSYGEKQEYKEAVKVFEELSDKKSLFNKNIALYLDKQEPSEGEELEEIFNRANYLYRQNKYKEALEYYWKARLLSENENIIRNYERTLFMIEKEKTKEQNNKHEKDKKNQDENNNKKENSKKENNKDNKENNQQKDNNNKEQKNNNESNGGNQEKDNDKNLKNNNEKESKKNKNKSDSNELEKKDLKNAKNTDEALNEKSKMGEKEAVQYLKMLSELEKEDLKNNHKAVRRGGDNEKTKNW